MRAGWARWKTRVVVLAIVGGVLYILYHWAPIPRLFNFLVATMNLLTLAGMVWTVYRNVKAPVPVLRVTFAGGNSEVVIKPVFHGCGLSDIEAEAAQEALRLYPDSSPTLIPPLDPLSPRAEDKRKFFVEWVRYRVASDSLCSVEFEICNDGRATAFSVDVVVTFPDDWELEEHTPNLPEEPTSLLVSPVVMQSRVLTNILADRGNPGKPEVRLDPAKHQIHFRIILVNPDTLPVRLPKVFVRPPCQNREYVAEVRYRTVCPGPSGRGAIHTQGTLHLRIQPCCHDSLDALYQDFARQYSDIFQEE